MKLYISRTLLPSFGLSLMACMNSTPTQEPARALEPLEVRSGTAIGLQGRDSFIEQDLYSAPVEQVLQDDEIKITRTADYYIVRADTDEVYGAAVGLRRQTNDYGTGFVNFGRNYDVALPSGSATFSGSYRGLDETAPQNRRLGVQYITHGDARLDVDFTNDTVAGQILNRTGRSPDGIGSVFSYDDITLNPTTIRSNGTFEGRAEGGDSYSNNSVPIGGRFHGLFAGDEASEMIGSVQIRTNSQYYIDNNFSSPRSTNETGVFLATKDD